MNQMLYQSLNQRWSANRGCFLMSVFSSKPSMQMHYFRVEYGSCGGNKKKPLTTALGRNPRVKTKGESMCKRLQFIASYGNNLIVHKFLVCQQVFLDFLIICYATSEIWIATIQSFCLSSHDSVLCRREDSFGVPYVKRV